MNLIMAFAALLPWVNLDLQQQLNLEQDLVLEQNGSPGLVLKKDTGFEVIDVMGLDSIQVEYYRIRMNACPTEMKDQTSDMTIINGVYGVELSKGCEVSLYVEFKDLYTETPFSQK